jgi:hypothetical protein
VASVKHRIHRRDGRWWLRCPAGPRWLALAGPDFETVRRALFEQCVRFDDRGRQWRHGVRSVR